jgi:hypothetical protein
MNAELAVTFRLCYNSDNDLDTIMSRNLMQSRCLTFSTPDVAGFVAHRFRAKGGKLRWLYGLLSEGQGHNLTVTV